MDLELAVEQLNQVIIRHEQTIDTLTRKVEAYRQQLQSIDAPIADAADETPPPHY